MVFQKKVVKNNSIFILIVLLVLSIFLFVGNLKQDNLWLGCCFSILVYICCLYRFHRSSIKVMGCAGVLLLYTFLTSYGLAIMQWIFGEESLPYSSKVLDFLQLNTYMSSLFLSDIAIILYTIFACRERVNTAQDEKESVNDSDEVRQYVYIVGIIFLLISFLFMFIMLITGKISLSMDYSLYRENMLSTTFYQYLIIIFSYGITFIAAVADAKQMIFGGVLFGLTAAILFMTGNRGEVLYPLLAAFGILQVRGVHIKARYIILGVFMIVIVIPFAFSARHSGGWSVALSSYSVGIKQSIISTFSEIGIQIRLTAYILNDFATGSRNYIYGYSYVEFILRWISKIFPIIDINPPVDFNFKSAYATMGFNQVAESFANCGILGVMIFYIILGEIMGRMENRKLDSLSLALLGAVCSVFINMSRNKFAFVPTYLIFILIIGAAIRMLCHNRRNK